MLLQVWVGYAGIHRQICRIQRFVAFGMTKKSQRKDSAHEQVQVLIGHFSLQNWGAVSFEEYHQLNVFLDPMDKLDDREAAGRFGPFLIQILQSMSNSLAKTQSPPSEPVLSALSFCIAKFFQIRTFLRSKPLGPEKLHHNIILNLRRLKLHRDTLRHSQTLLSNLPSKNSTVIFTSLWIIYFDSAVTIGSTEHLTENVLSDILMRELPLQCLAVEKYPNLLNCARVAVKVFGFLVENGKMGDIDGFHSVITVLKYCVGVGEGVEEKAILLFQEQLRMIRGKDVQMENVIKVFQEFVELTDGSSCILWLVHIWRFLALKREFAALSELLSGSKENDRGVSKVVRSLIAGMENPKLLRNVVKFEKLPNSIFQPFAEIVYILLSKTSQHKYVKSWIIELCCALESRTTSKSASLLWFKVILAHPFLVTVDSFTTAVHISETHSLGIQMDDLFNRMIHKSEELSEHSYLKGPSVLFSTVIDFSSGKLTRLEALARIEGIQCEEGLCRFSLMLWKVLLGHDMESLQGFCCTLGNFALEVDVSRKRWGSNLFPRHSELFSRSCCYTIDYLKLYDLNEEYEQFIECLAILKDTDIIIDTIGKSDIFEIPIGMTTVSQVKNYASEQRDPLQRFHVLQSSAIRFDLDECPIEAFFLHEQAFRCICSLLSGGCITDISPWKLQRLLMEQILFILILSHDIGDNRRSIYFYKKYFSLIEKMDLSSPLKVERDILHQIQSHHLLFLLEENDDGFRPFLENYRCREQKGRALCRKHLCLSIVALQSGDLDAFHSLFCTALKAIDFTISEDPCVLMDHPKILEKHKISSVYRILFDKYLQFQFHRNEAISKSPKSHVHQILFQLQNKQFTPDMFLPLSKLKHSQTRFTRMAQLLLSWLPEHLKYSVHNFSINPFHESLYELSKISNDSFEDAFELLSVKTIESFEEYDLSIEKEMVALPSSWTIVSLSLDTIRDMLLCTRYSKHEGISCFEIGPFQDKLAEFNQILQDTMDNFKYCNQNLSPSLKQEKWNQRFQLDQSLSQLLLEIENDVLGAYKGLLFSSLSETSNLAIEDVMSTFADEFGIQSSLENNERQLFRSLCLCASSISSSQLKTAFNSIFLSTPSQSFIRKLKSFSKSLDTPSNPLILILDSHIAQIPWESVPFLYSQSVTRMPSLCSVFRHIKCNSNLLLNQINPNNGFYVLNPSRDLPRTETIFAPTFSKFKWQGICGKVPEEREFEKALSDHELYIYCGHGGGQQFFGPEKIQKIQVKATSLLLGCSSGIVSSFYLLSGAPAVLANLWDVTDADLDRFAQSLFEEWLVKDGSDGALVTAMNKARKACKLRYLIGGAAVCFGLPVKVAYRLNQ